MIREPRCSHSTRNGSTLVSSHKNLLTAKGKIASVRVCYRDACVDEAVAWVRVMGPGTVWVGGVKR